MSPLQRYQEALTGPDFHRDPAQETAVRALDDLYRRLTAPRKSGWVGRFLDQPKGPIRGLYLWGGVGRGKTYLMDVFFDALPFDEKLRLHFHRFMQLVHQRMHAIGGGEDPLESIAGQFSQQARVLCLDEMHINDIGDAAIIYKLLKGLFSRGMTLVTTSNRIPKELGADPILRQSFAQAVRLLETHTDVLNVDGGTDYRLRSLEKAATWRHPLDEASAAALERAFTDCAGAIHPNPAYILINERKIAVHRWTDGVVWFDFNVICGVPRARTDLIEIARYFHTALIGGIPQLTDSHNDLARRFTHLIDEFYDRNVKVLASCSVPVETLYVGKELAFEYQRTVSRLQEMQTLEYLSREHLP